MTSGGISSKIGKMQNGKGDKPRSGFNKVYRDNFDQINWGRNTEDLISKEIIFPEREEINFNETTVIKYVRI